VTPSADRNAELRDELFPVEIVSSDRVFTGHVWDIRSDRFVYGDDEIVRDYVDHTGAVAILALDDRGRVLLIKQYRHPIGKRDWEIPAGLLDIAGESPLVAAQRELAEEVDLVAARWNVLVDLTTSPGGSNEVVRIYLAREVSATPAAFERTEEELDIEKRWVPLGDAVDAFLGRAIGNSILGIAVLAAQVGLDRGWSSLGPADAPWVRSPKTDS
jgi:8-oxo-dGTP pyrophosphatase MutT (NUDIX family)